MNKTFVVGASDPNGGTYMAYQLGRILHSDFGFTPISVSDRDAKWDHSKHLYDLQFETISVDEMEKKIDPDDILIANPSFSASMFSLRIPGRKICYVQGFNTFSLLDVGFNHYVAVSNFVQNFLKSVYDLSAPVIPPYIDRDGFPNISSWLDRAEDSVAVYLKGPHNFAQIALERIKSLTANKLDGAEIISAGSLARRELLSKIASCRYFVSLSPAEGFGLVPLEAMALHTAAVGFDGFGGRHYFKNMENCAVASYPNINRIGEYLIELFRNPALAEKLAANGKITADGYTYNRFRAAWKTYLTKTVGLAPLQ